MAHKDGAEWNRPQVHACAAHHLPRRDSERQPKGEDLTEIRVQRKPRRSRKWLWLLLLLIPAAWFALRKGEPEGGDAAATRDSTRAASTAADTVKKADSTKPPR